MLVAGHLRSVEHIVKNASYPFFGKREDESHFCLAWDYLSTLQAAQ